MRKLTQKYPKITLALALIPFAAIAHFIGWVLKWSSNEIVSVQLPCLGFQFFMLWVFINYRLK